LLLGAFALLALAPGCERRILSPDSPGFAEQFGDLPRLSHISNLKLSREARRLKNERMFPSQLQGNSKPFSHWVFLAAANKSPKSTKNTAVALASVFTRGKVRRLLRESHELFPKRFPPWPEELRKLSRRRIQNEDSRVRFRTAMQLPECDFGVEFERGLMADFMFVDFMRVGADLESYYAIESLMHGDRAEAIEAAESILTAARRLMEAKHPTPRLAAADMHRQALWVMNACLGLPDASSADARRCLELVHRQLDRWPNERDVWVGDRSDGLHAFEMIREGYVLSVFRKEEFERIERDIGIDRFEVAVAATIDFDELFYLEATRRLIDGCEKPYSHRIGVFEELATEMSRLRGTEKHPFVSDWILLPHLQMGHRECALDLARMQGMSLALSHVLGVTPREYLQNPFTGLVYRVENNSEAVRIFGIGPEADDEPIVIKRAVAEIGRLPRP